MKYRVGDKVRIINNINNHDFPIGEVVTISCINEDDQDYRAESHYGYWYVTDEELEPVNP